MTTASMNMGNTVRLNLSPADESVCRIIDETDNNMTNDLLLSVTVIAQLPTHSFGTLQNQPKRRSLSNPLENQLAVG